MAKPNVIVITPHDLGDFLGCYGAPVPTPHLDALADGGVLFADHFSTGTVCSPSRGSIVTGCYPHTHGLMGLVHRGWSLDTERCPTLAHMLRDAGHQTHVFGFQHEHYDPTRLGYEHSHTPGAMPLVDQVVPQFIDWLQADQAQARPFLAAIGFCDVHRFGSNPSHFARDAYEPADPDRVEVPAWLPDISEVREEFDFLIPEIEGAKIQFRHPQVFNHYSARRCTEELYDLDADPGELHNLADDAQHQAVLNELRAALDAHLAATCDPFAQTRNDLLMPETEYAPAMRAMWQQFA